MKPRYDLIVVGGGISGLSMARFAAADGWQTLLLEAGSRVGGCIHTARLRPDGEEFWVELGAHTLFNSYGTLIRLLEERGLLARLQRRGRLGYRLWERGRLHSIARELDYRELAASLPRALFTSKRGKAVGEYYGALVGRGNFARVIGPALDAVICQPAGSFPAEMLFRPKPRRRGLPRSFTLQGGLSLLAEGIAGEPIDLKTGARVEGIELTGGGFRCLTATAEYAGRRLALALPAEEAGHLLATIRPLLGALLARIPTSTVDSTAVAVDATRVNLPPLAGLIGRDAPFFSVVTRDVVPDPRLRGFTFHFPGERYGERERSAIAAGVLGLQPEDLPAVAHARHRLPALRAGHRDLLLVMERELEGSPLALTGNYFEGLSLEECVARSYREYRRLAGR